MLGSCQWRAFLACLSLILVWPGAASAANSSPDLAFGVRVRVTELGVARKPLVGTLGAAEDGFISVGGQSVPRAEIGKLEVSRGHKSRVRGLLIGLGAGAALGAVIGAATNSTDCRTNFFCKDPGVAAAGFAILGGGAGALAGALVPPGERWETVSADRVHVSLGLAGGRGFGARLSLSF